MNISEVKKVNVEGISLLLSLMILVWFLLPGGPRPASWALLLLSVWLIFNRRSNLSDLGVRRITYSLLLLIVPVGISISSSYNQGATILTFIALVLFVFVAISMRAGFRSEQSHEDFQKWFLWIYIFFVFDGVLQYFSGQSLFGITYQAGSNERLQGASGDDLHYGIFLSVLMPLALWRLCERRQTYAISIMMIVIFLVVMSGARTSILFSLLAAILLFFRIGSKYRVISILLVSLVFLVSYQVSPVVKERVMATQIDELSESQLDQLLSWRLSAWKTGLNMLRLNPITGVGANAFEEAYVEYRVNQHDPFPQGGIYHAHQLYVGLAAETGWPGLLGFLLIISSVYVWWRKSSDVSKRLAAPYAASLSVIIFPINSQPVLYTLWWFPLVLLLFVGMVSALSHDPYGKSQKGLL
jgi:O-antigen ligase